MTLPHKMEESQKYDLKPRKWEYLTPGVGPAVYLMRTRNTEENSKDILEKCKYCLLLGASTAVVTFTAALVGTGLIKLLEQ